MHVCGRENNALVLNGILAIMIVLNYVARLLGKIQRKGTRIGTCWLKNIIFSKLQSLYIISLIHGKNAPVKPWEKETDLSSSSLCETGCLILDDSPMCDLRLVHSAM
jgi:hypothetical protein